MTEHAETALHVQVPALVSSTPVRSDVDEGAAVCAFLVGRRVLSCTRLANDLGTRPLLIEECIRQRYSSRALRAQLSHYLQEHSAVAARLPTSLLQGLQQAHARDVVPAGSPLATGNAAAREPTTEEDMLDMLDPSSKNHFLSLESAVGQSFSSIMNDPAGSRAGGAVAPAADDWGGWLGGKLSSAFDHTGSNGSGNRPEEALNALRVSYQTNDQSSVMLLAEHAPDGGFDDYVRLISAAYAVNHKESHSTTTSVFGRDKCKTEDLPWPTGVPADVFDRQYTPRSELLKLPLAVPSASTTTTATTAPAAPAAKGPSAKGLSAKDPSAPTQTATQEEQALAGRKVIERDAFVQDTERLEARSAELRAWEEEVERCLLEHVRNKSEDFFSASLQFTLLSGGAGEALASARASRQSGVAPAQSAVKKYLEVGVLHRRRQNYQALSELVGKVGEMRGRLERVENWVALQERDMAELPKFVSNLLSLQRFIAERTRAVASTDQSADTEDTETAPASGPRSSWVARLKCLQDVPSRAAQVDTAMKALVVQTLVAHVVLSSPRTDAGAAKSLPAVPTLAQVCDAATALGVFDTAIRQYQAQVVQNIWPVAQAAVLNTLMNTENALTDEAADKLFSLSTRSAAAEAVPPPPPAPPADKPRKGAAAQASAKTSDPTTPRKAFLEFVTSQVRFPVLLVLVSQLQEALCDYVTQVAQELAALVVVVACRAPSAEGGAQSAALREMCASVLVTVRDETEFILAQVILLRQQHVMPSDTGEVESLVAAGYRWTSLLAVPVMELENMQGCELAGLGEAVFANGKSPIRTACQKLCRHYFRAWHTQQVEKLTMVLDNETWDAREDISAIFQAHLGELCRSDQRAVDAFDALSVEPSAAATSGLPTQPAARSRRSTVTAASLALSTHTPSARRGIPGGAVDDDDLLAAGTANRLFLSLDDEHDGGRVVCSAFLILVEQLYSYDQYVAHFPSVALETTVRMQELLALFDARTASLILGAKAVENGALRSISTQHLCVASQCVALLSEFVPLLQQRLLCVFRVQDANDTATAAPNAQPAKLRPFIEKDMSRTTKDARAHRNECYQKIVSLVKAKVDSLGRVEPTGQWPASGNEWVMTMLRETARLLRALKPYLPPMDIQGVVAPLLGTFAGEVREVTRVIPEKAADARATATSDVLLFRANVEKFGYDVLLCAATTSPATAMRSTLSPQSSEQQILDWFFPKPRAAATAMATTSST